MKQSQNLIKEDINFLEYPNWVINKRESAKVWRIERNNGVYEISGLLSLPTHFDKIVLYFLLYKLYKETGLKNARIQTTRYEIAKNVFPGIKSYGKNKYERIMVSLRKWNNIAITFDGIFYEGDGHTFRAFHIINELKLQKETGLLTIEFNASYLRQLAETEFYILIDFNQYRKLQKASSARLYEILIKTFKDRTEWAINIQLLAEKLTFEKREGAKQYYPSDVLQYIKPAVNEINKKTDMYIKMDFNKDTQVVVFKSLPAKTKQEYVPAMIEKKDYAKDKKKADLLKQYQLLSDSEKDFIHASINDNQFYKYLAEDERVYAWMSQNYTKSKPINNKD